MSDRDLDIIEVILRYRFIPASALVRLVGGNEDVTHRRLRRLWEVGLINRWAFPGIRMHSEFNYYLDNREAIDALIVHGRIGNPHPAMFDELRSNREKNYADAAYRGQHMQLGFLQHSLMVSRMHFMLEMACRQTRSELTNWSQGGQLAGKKVEVQKIAASRQGGQPLWREAVEIERLPVEPDALFTVAFPDPVERQRTAHFFYEADRGTMTMTAMFRKLRAYFHFVKQQKHRDAFGVHPMRAVLIETTTEARAQKLMELVHHPLLRGPDKRSGLFWFTISPLFLHVGSRAETQELSHGWLIHPDIVLGAIWATSDRAMHSICDSENLGHSIEI